MDRFRSFLRISFAVLVGLVVVEMLNAAQPTPARYRYLFIIDTSEAMAAHKSEIARFVSLSIQNGFDGWIRRNETIGFWTCNEKLTRDAFPVEFWTTSQKERIAGQAERLLAESRFWRSCRLGLAVAELKRVVASSDAITVFIISDGRQPIQGTPFDGRINDVYASHIRGGAMQSPPIITRLTAARGEFSSWAVQRLEDGRTQFRSIESSAAEVAPSQSAVTTNATPARSNATNGIALDQSVLANAAKPKELPLEKPLPPAPVLAKELLAPIRVTPLQFEVDDSHGGPQKFRRPVLVISAEPSRVISEKTMPQEPKPEETKLPVPATVTPPASNVTSTNALKKTEPGSELYLTNGPLAGRIAKAEMAIGTNTLAPKMAEKSEDKTIAESANLNAQQGNGTTTNLLVPTVLQAQTVTTQAVLAAQVPVVAPQAQEKVDTTVPPKDAGDARTRITKPAPLPSPTETRAASLAVDPPASRQEPELADAASPSSAPTRFLFASLGLLVLSGLLICSWLRRSRGSRQSSLISRGFDRTSN